MVRWDQPPRDMSRCTVGHSRPHGGHEEGTGAAQNAHATSQQVDDARTGPSVGLALPREGRPDDQHREHHPLGRPSVLPLSWACSVPAWSCRPWVPPGRSPGPASTCSTRCRASSPPPPLSQQSKILDAKGNVIATPHDENRVIIPLDQVAPVMQKAQIAIEDSRFFEHGGVDMRGMVRALVSNASGAVNTPGGSTLTQQYVKLTLLDTALKAGTPRRRKRGHPEGPGRRHPQAPGAEVRDPAREGADEGPDPPGLPQHRLLRRPGVRRAGRGEALLQQGRQGPRPAEAALLAGLAQNPGTTDPVHNPDKALSRRNVVLDRMHELGLITDKDLTDAKAVTLDQMLKVTSAPTACQASGDVYAYFCDYVIKWLELDPSLEASLGKTVDERKAKIFGGGLTIQTTIDPDLAARPATRCSTRVPKGNSYTIGAAAVTLDPNTGAVKSMAQNTNYILGSKNFGETVVNWGVDTKYGGSGGFQFGSTEKAFTLVTALEKGLPINTNVNAKQASPSQAASYTNADLPDACGVPKRAPAWNVRNDETAGGQMSITQATARSINTAFIALAGRSGSATSRRPRPGWACTGPTATRSPRSARRASSSGPRRSLR